jgi:hypothetical protein
VYLELWSVSRPKEERTRAVDVVLEMIVSHACWPLRPENVFEVTGLFPRHAPTTRLPESSTAAQKGCFGRLSRLYGFFQTCAYQPFAGIFTNDRIVIADFAKREFPFRRNNGHSPPHAYRNSAIVRDRNSCQF